LSENNNKTISDDDLRELMYGFGYEVPKQTTKKQTTPLLNIDQKVFLSKSRGFNDNSIDEYETRKLTKEQYNKIRTEDRGTRISKCGLYKFRCACALVNEEGRGKL
jgi:hypothetical protein